MGLGEDDVREIHATIGHGVKQGLRSSADVQQTTKAIRNGLALLERGMTQGTLGQLSNAIPESRANLLMDLVSRTLPVITAISASPPRATRSVKLFDGRWKVC